MGTSAAAGGNRHEYRILDCHEVARTLGQHPGIVAVKNGLLLTYSDYTDAMEGASGYLIRSTDNGKTWSEPELVIRSRLKQGGIHLTLGMQAVKGGRVLIPWCDAVNHKKYPRGRSDFICLRSDNNGLTWKGWDPQDTGLHQFSPYGKITQLDNGTLLCPGWGYCREEDAQPSSGVLFSYDNGETWRDYCVIAQGFNETDLTLLGNGKILAMLRGKKAALAWTFQSVSTDNGATWTEPEPANVLGQNFNAWITPKGTLVGACRGIDGTGKLKKSEITADSARYTKQRGYGIHLFTAVDEGMNWEYRFTLPDPNSREHEAWHEAGEPCFANLPDGDMIIGYYSYSKSIFDTLNLSGMPDFTRDFADTTIHVFLRRICVCVIREI